MKKKVKYTDERMGKPRVVGDFLPAPKALVFKGYDAKVAMTLSKSRSSGGRAKRRRAA